MRVETVRLGLMVKLSQAPQAGGWQRRGGIRGKRVGDREGEGAGGAGGGGREGGGRGKGGWLGFGED